MGRTFKGADCYGIAYLYAKENGISLPEYPEKLCGSSNEIKSSISEELENFYKITPGKERALDLILFKILGEPVHIGIVVSPGIMLHSFQGNGFSSVESYRSILWVNRIDSIWRPRK